MRFFVAMCAVLVVIGSSWSCGTSQRPERPQIHKVKIKVDKDTKVTRIKKVDAYREDSIEFTAEAGPVTIIIPTGGLVIDKSSTGTGENHGHWISLQLEENQSAVLLIPPGFPDNRHDRTKKRVIWYLVICGTGADAYPGEDESPPRVIIRPR